jgi:gliding motility-associated-like protein
LAALLKNSFPFNTSALLAPSGFLIYQWSNGQTTQGISVSTAGTYSVVVGNAANCLSTASTATTIASTGQPCTGGPTIDPNNKPPVIVAAKVNTAIGGKIILSLAELISDPDNSIDFTTLRIVQPPASGAVATINASQELTIDYGGIQFSGQETLTLQVCDVSASCSQQQIIIDVTGEIKVYNAISPNGDGLNDALFIEYISIIDEAKNNTVRIFNRWGDVVYEAENYNNTTIAFRGLSTSGDPIPSGTYFYRIDFRSGIPVKTGFFSLRR